MDSNYIIWKNASGIRNDGALFFCEAKLIVSEGVLEEGTEVVLRMHGYEDKTHTALYVYHFGCELNRFIVNLLSLALSHLLYTTSAISLTCFGFINMLNWCFFLKPGLLIFSCPFLNRTRYQSHGKRETEERQS